MPTVGDAAATATARATTAAPRRLGADGRYRSGGILSIATIGVYAFLVVLILVFGVGTPSTYPYAIYVVLGLVVFFLLRYLTVTYTIDDVSLRTFRLAGGRQVRLEDVRKIEYASLRELAPTGFFGSWGWRGRMWSPAIGAFDALHTDSKGLLVTAGTVPMFISPRHTADFARELSRRVRSYTGPLGTDVGAPEA